MKKEIIDFINQRLDKEEHDRHVALNGANSRILLLEEGALRKPMFMWIIGGVMTVCLLLFANMQSVSGELRAYQNEVFNKMSDINSSVAVIQVELIHLNRELKKLNLIEE
jgi:hypothetical protein